MHRRTHHVQNIKSNFVYKALFIQTVTQSALQIQIIPLCPPTQLLLTHAHTHTHTHPPTLHTRTHTRIIIMDMRLSTDEPGVHLFDVPFKGSSLQTHLKQSCQALVYQNKPLCPHWTSLALTADH